MFESNIFFNDEYIIEYTRARMAQVLEVTLCRIFAIDCCRIFSIRTLALSTTTTTIYFSVKFIWLAFITTSPVPFIHNGKASNRDLKTHGSLRKNEQRYHTYQLNMYSIHNIIFVCTYLLATTTTIAKLLKITQ